MCDRITLRIVSGVTASRPYLYMHCAYCVQRLMSIIIFILRESNELRGIFTNIMYSLQARVRGTANACPYA